MEIQLLIRRAFLQVRPGQIGIREAQAMDDRLVEPELSQARAQDTEQDWSAIPGAVLYDHQCVWTYLDDPGFKFLMPAVMTLASRDDAFEKTWIVESLFYHLVPASRRDEKGTCAIITRLDLNPLQIQATGVWIRDYLLRYPFSLSGVEEMNLKHWEDLS